MLEHFGQIFMALRTRQWPDARKDSYADFFNEGLIAAEQIILGIYEQQYVPTKWNEELYLLDNDLYYD